MVTSTVATRPAQIELSGVTKRFLTPSGSMFTALRAIDLVMDIATHDHYHSAQIFVLKRLLTGAVAPSQA